ncbi:LytTR family transcriptional regulator DNA-binding domain-containing protein [Paenibacillus sp. BR2-3]|uniref:LytTR family transcriptional regulator DNA-binding domain-containing protein n=1 Tax=Paenibacillus sp. BR2-3 TaxID=3048494 RepID=UPI003977835B
MQWVQANLSEIRYVSCTGKHNNLIKTLHLKDEKLNYEGSFDELRIFLTSQNFLQIDRGLVVNLEKVDYVNLKKNEVHLKDMDDILKATSIKSKILSEKLAI